MVPFRWSTVRPLVPYLLASVSECEQSWKEVNTENIDLLLDWPVVVPGSFSRTARSQILKGRFSVKGSRM